MTLKTERYLAQLPHWPTDGRHILAHFDDASIIVYQAYRASTAHYALQHGALGGPNFSYARMSWIKPNFLWMMYRSGWGTKEGQEGVLAFRIRRPFFEELLASAVASSFDPAQHADHDVWKRALAQSDVRLQWDPDHDPTGAMQNRRAIQLGLRGAALESFGQREIIEVIDVSAFVAEQHQVMSNSISDLVMPVERVYRPGEPAARNLGVTLQE